MVADAKDVGIIPGVEPDEQEADEARNGIDQELVETEYIEKQSAHECFGELDAAA